MSSSKEEALVCKSVPKALESRVHGIIVEESEQDESRIRNESECQSKVTKKQSTASSNHGILPDMRNIFLSSQAMLQSSRLSLVRNYCSSAPNRDLRCWQLTSYGKIYNQTRARGLDFTVMSYNVLAQALLEMHPQLYRDCNPSYLRWEYRSNLILQEIKMALPDVLCLQEAQSDHYEDFFTPQLAKLGYLGYYKQRPAGKVDGCCIFYRKSVFSLEDAVSIEYRQPGVPLLNRDNVGVIVKLRSKKSPSEPLCVANTHLLFNPKRHDIKLAQTQLLLSELDKLAYRGESRSGEPLYCPSILTGDFNADVYSCVHQLLNDGYVRYEGKDTKSLRQQFRGGPINLMGRELLPPTLGITDSCQHHSHVELRGSRLTSTTSPGTVAMETGEASRVSSGVSDRGSSPAKDPSPKVSLSAKYPFRTGVLSHKFNLRSVYRPGRNYQDGPVTTFQDEWIKVDHMFYSMVYSEKMDKAIEGKLKLIGRYRLPSGRECLSLGHLPTKCFPSDHLFLLARFLLKK